LSTSSTFDKPSALASTSAAFTRTNCRRWSRRSLIVPTRPRVFGNGHQDVGGVFNRDSIVGVFGAARERG